MIEKVIGYQLLENSELTLSTITDNQYPIN